MKIRNEEFSKKFFGYFLIAVISVCLNLVGYNVAIKVLKSQIVKNDEMLLKNVSNMGDSYFEIISNTAVSFTSSELVKRLSSNYMDNTDRTMAVNSVLYEMANADRFPNYSCNNNYSILMRNRYECLQSRMGIASIDSVFNSKYRDLFESSGAWIDSAYATRGVKYSTMITNQGDNLLLSCHIPRISRDIAVMVRVDLSYIKEIFNSVADKYTYYALIDENSNVLVSSEKNSFEDLSEIKHHMDAKEIKQASSVAGLNYVKFTNIGYYTKKINRVRLVFMACFLLCLIIGVVISYTLSGISERKEKRLVEEISKHKNAIMREELKKLILKDRREVDSASLRELTLRAEGSCFVMVLSDLWFFESDDIAECDEAMLKKLNIWIDNSVLKIPNVMSVNGCVIDDNIVSVIGLSQENKMDLCVTLEEMCKVSEKEFGITMQCIVSSFTQNFMEVNKLYKEIIQTSNRLFIDNEKKYVIDSEKEEEPEFPYKDDDVESKLTALLKNGDAEKALEFCNAVIKGISIDTIENGKFAVGTLLNAIIKVSREFKIDENIENMIAEISQYYDTSAYFKIKDSIGRYIRTLCDAEKLWNGGTDEQTKKCRIVKEYFEKNYSDSMLNVNILADKFGVSRSWLSVQFKKEYGETLSDYIVKFRLKKTKELLAQNIPVSKVAELGGFTNKAMFYRAFKKYENITVGQYRELISLKSNNEKNTDVERKEN